MSATGLFAVCPACLGHPAEGEPRQADGMAGDQGWTWPPPGWKAGPCPRRSGAVSLVLPEELEAKEEESVEEVTGVIMRRSLEEE